MRRDEGVSSPLKNSNRMDNIYLLSCIGKGKGDLF
jgi:hypothetical protein